MLINYNDLQCHVKMALQGRYKTQKTLREIKSSKTGIEAYGKVIAYADEISSEVAAVLSSALRCAGIEGATFREEASSAVLLPVILASAQYVGDAADAAQMQFNREIGLGVAPVKRRRCDVMAENALLKIWPAGERVCGEDDVKNALCVIFAEIVRNTISENWKLHKEIGAFKSEHSLSALTRLNPPMLLPEPLPIASGDDGSSLPSKEINIEGTPYLSETREATIPITP